MKHLKKFENYDSYEEIEEISLEGEDEMDAEIAAEMEAEEMVEDTAEEMATELSEDDEEEDMDSDEHTYEGISKFDDFLVNEEGGIRKFFTGVSDDTEKDELKSKLMSELDKYESMGDVVVNRKDLEAKAEDNDYIGSLRLTPPVKQERSKYYGKRVVQYVTGQSGLRKTFSPGQSVGTTHGVMK